MPDADLVFQFVLQVFVPPVTAVGALVAVLYSMLMVYDAIVEMYDILRPTPRERG
jgi:hypothetical protein